MLTNQQFFPWFFLVIGAKSQPNRDTNESAATKKTVHYEPCTSDLPG